MGQNHTTIIPSFVGASNEKIKMSFLLFLVLTSSIIVSVALIDHVYNNGELFFVTDKKELTQALIIFSIPFVNIMVLIIIIQKHIMRRKNEQDGTSPPDDY